LVTQKLFPGDVARVGVRQDNGPVFTLNLVGVTRDPQGFAGQGAGAGLGSTVDIDTFFVNNQGVCQGTDLDETIPVAARASQAGGLQAQHGASVPETNLRDERLKAVSVSGRDAGLALILVNDDDPLT
jgi:hypothetical protein